MKFFAKNLFLFVFFSFALIFPLETSAQAENFFTCHWDEGFDDGSGFIIGGGCTSVAINECGVGYTADPSVCQSITDQFSCENVQRACVPTEDDGSDYTPGQPIIPGSPTLINPQTNQNPFPPPEEIGGCWDTYTWNGAPADFHSLRPFQASSCYSEGTDIDYFMCANDLITVERFTLGTPFQGISGVNSICRQEIRDGETVYICDYNFEDRIIDVNIDLSNARLPIMGITEGTLENNSQYKPFGDLTEAQKMNEFVSWYLNGAMYRAEHNWPTTYADYPEHKEDWSDTEYHEIMHEAGKVINFSGPLNKLLPLRIAQEERIEEIDRTTEEVSSENIGENYLNENDRHNQIAACIYRIDSAGYLSSLVDALGFLSSIFEKIGLPGALSSYGDIGKEIPGPCYPEMDDNDNAIITSKIDIKYFFDTTLTVKIDRIRLSKWNEDDKLPPNPNNYEHVGEYWRDYKRWRGEFCPFIGVDGFGVYFCYNDPGDVLRSDTWASLFPYIPLTSTEDMLGWIEPLPVPRQAGGEVTIITPEFEFVNGATVDHKLYFPHMQEGSELGQIAQSMFVSGIDESLKTNWITKNGFSPSETRYIYDTNYCEPVESRGGLPGDSLFGNYDGTDGTDEAIAGTITYSGDFSCEFTETVDEEAVALCIEENPTYTLDFCVQINTSYNTCQVQARTAMSIYVGTPKVQEVWERLVDGDQSIFKRFYPQTGVGTPVEEIEDIPAETNISYTSTADQTFAGDPAAMRPGTNAKMYIPHLGSIYDYFLKGIQKALRPDGGSLPVTTVGQSLAPVENTFESIACPTGPYKEITDYIETNDGGACEINCEFVPDFAIPTQYLAMKDAFVDYVNRWYYPSQSEYNHAEQCFNDVVQKSLEAGVNPIYSLEFWAQESGASNYHAAGCAVQDFGINDPSIASNFKAQLGRFLRLPFVYPRDYPQCFADGCNIGSFSRVYQQGADAQCTYNASAQAYAEKTVSRITEFTDCVPIYLTDFSCP